MKKFLAVLFIATYMLTLAGCSKGNSSSQYNDATLLSAEELMKYATVVEITAENWKDYLTFESGVNEKLYYTIVDVNVQDAFAYVWLNEDYRYNVIHLIDSNTGKNDQISLGMANDKTKQLTNLEGLTIENYEFISSENKLVLFDIPEDLWSYDKDGNAYVYYGSVEKSGSVTTLNGGQIFQNDMISHGSNYMQKILDNYFK